MKRVGIDIGSTTVKIAVLDDNNNILFSAYERHYANIQETLRTIMEEKEVSCVYRADGTKSLGAILNECGMTMAEFFEKNNPEQIIIAADVLFEVPKKV